MSTEVSTTPPVSARTRRLTRAVAAVLAALGALLVWVVADPLFGVDFTVVADGTTTVVGPAMVIIFALAAALAGWAVLALLERFTARPRLIWLIAAVTVLALSLVMPFNAGDVDTGAVVALLAMHLVVGAVIIPTYARTSR